AQVLGGSENLGALEEGGPADISVLDYVEGPFELVDCHGVKKVLEKGLVPELAVCRGKVLKGEV
ncbi:MAG: amidohydrolase/deacetylase family metallohydrolase, partial [Anaerolineales bacterium]